MPPRGRRTPEPSVVGLKLMAGLPTNDGLSPVAPTLEPMASVLVVGRLVVGRGNINYRKDSGQRVLEIEEIEASLTAEESAIVQGILDAARERRTGELVIGGEQTELPDDVVAPDEPDDWAETRAPGASPHPDTAAERDEAAERRAAKVAPIKSTRGRRRG